jgi:Flp pilus assembly protein TadD
MPESSRSAMGGPERFVDELFPAAPGSPAPAGRAPATPVPTPGPREAQPEAVTARAAQLAEDDPDRALELLSGVVRVHPEHWPAVLARARLLIRSMRWNDAEAELRRAVRALPGSAEALRELGMVLSKKGLTLEAAEHLRRVTELRPESTADWYYLGEALNRAGRFAEAHKALLRASELDPHSTRTWQLLGRILDRLRRPDDAMAMYRRARELPRR